jgi:hypothetical protein
MNRAHPSRLSLSDLLRLRLAVNSARRSQLKAELARQSVRELLLEMEQRYGLLGRDASLDVHTGRIQGEGGA